MRYLTPFIFGLVLIFGLQPVQAQVDMSGFEQLFEAASSNVGSSVGSSVGGGGDGQTTDQTTQDNRDGGGNVDMINANWPVLGKMVIRSTKLTWNDGITPTMLILKQGSREVFKTPVSGSSVTVDFSQLGLEAGKTYNLQLTDGDKKSKRTSIQFVEASELQSALEELENDIAYKKAEGVKKKLMKAFFLESKTLNYEAYEAYHISTADPDDMNIILSFFNSFKSRT